MEWRNNGETLESIAEEINKIKVYMAEAKQRKDELEQKIVDLSGLSPHFEGTHPMEAGRFAIKVKGKINRRVDGDALQKVAQEAGLFDYLSKLFRWKPEINKREWDKASPEVTNVLAQAVVATPAKPSIEIEEV
ncbi:MAG: hypothetical protein EOM02_11935 [Synergistales bacterium]|nr:hypothetical protein [Synergistales bacterium]